MSDEEKFEEQLGNLIDLILAEKKFRFKIDELSFAHDLLVSGKVITVSSGEAELNDYEKLMPKVISELEIILDLSATESVEATNKFLIQAQAYFPDGVLMGRTSFYQALIGHVILLFMEKGNGMLIDLANQFSKKDRSIYQFSRGLGDVLPQISIPGAELITLLEWLHSEIKADRSDVVDGNVISLGHAVKALCAAQPDLAIELYNSLILTESTLLLPYHPSVMIAILERDSKFLDDVKNMLAIPNLQQIAICTLSATNPEAKEVLVQFIKCVDDLLINFESVTPAARLELPRFYSNMIIYSDGDEVKCNSCFKSLQLIASLEPKLMPGILNNITYIDGFDEQRADLITNFMEQEKPEQHGLKAGLAVFYNFKTVGLLFAFIKMLSTKYPFKFHEEFREIISLYQLNHLRDCDEALIKLLIDDLGSVRFTGLRILHGITMQGGKPGFNIEYHALSPVDQYKLVCAIAEDFHEPKYIVPLIVPFLDSKFTLVRDLVLHRLEIMSEDYFFDVVEIMKMNLSADNAQHQDYIDQIHSYTQVFNDALNKKWEIKELNPRYNQYKYYKQYHDEYQKMMQQVVEESSKKSPLMSLFGKNVMLAKGGGYYMQEKDTVMPLSKIETKMSLPRSYFLAPELYDYEMRLKMFEDWTNKFTKWEAMISS